MSVKLLDESTSNLDVESKLITEILKQNITIAGLFDYDTHHRIFTKWTTRSIKAINV